jgi:heat shock protein HtpX
MQRIVLFLCPNLAIMLMLALVSACWAIIFFNCEIVFGVLAGVLVVYFSRRQDVCADAGAPHLWGSPQPMFIALHRLCGMETAGLPQNRASSGIAGGRSWSSLFATHPGLEARLPALHA